MQRLAILFVRFWGGRRANVLLVQTVMTVASCVFAAHGYATAENAALVDRSAAETIDHPFSPASSQQHLATVAVTRVGQSEVELSLSAPVESHQAYLHGRAE